MASRSDDRSDEGFEDGFDDGLTLLLSSLSISPSTSALADELEALSAIYSTTTPALRLHLPPPAVISRLPRSTPPPLRLQLTTTIPGVPTPDGTETVLHLVLSLPPSYPSSSPPLIQLQDIYLGAYLVSPSLFASVLRCFMHDPTSGEGVEWTGEVCLFEGVEWVREKCAEWVGERVGEGKRGEGERGGEPAREEQEEGEEEEEGLVESWEVWEEKEVPREREKAVECPRIVSSEPVVDRKSVFVGHCAEVHSAEEVELVMAELLSDKKIAKATHNISAYRITKDGLSLQDNDDDGENAAGSRLAYLLTLLEVHDVVVVVSRWYGGIQLGADRFKHINAAARDALSLGGFLAEHDAKVKKHSHGKKR